MKRYLSIFFALALIFALFTGCKTNEANNGETADTENNETMTPEDEGMEADETEPIEGTIRLASLKGPTTMGLVKLLDEAENGGLSYEVESSIYGTADEVSALLINGELDMAAIPANLASVLFNKTEGAIKVAAINTLGVLSVLELGDSVNSISDLAGKTVYSTGKGTTPEYSLNAILSGNGIDPETGLTVEFKSEATEIAALLSGETAVSGTIAVLPQPYATTVLMANPEARIALSLSDEWEKASLDGRLVTGVLVVSSDFAENNPELLEAFLADYESSASWVNENQEDAAELIADIGIVPKSEVALKALPYCSITFISGSAMKADLSAYLGALFEQNPQSVGGTLPDDSFYYGT